MIWGQIDPKALFYLCKMKQHITELAIDMVQMFYLTFLIIKYF